VVDSVPAVNHFSHAFFHALGHVLNLDSHSLQFGLDSADINFVLAILRRLLALAKLLEVGIASGQLLVDSSCAKRDCTLRVRETVVKLFELVFSCEIR
jgi:hypothetical protein